MLFVTLERPNGTRWCLQEKLSPKSEEVEVGFSFREHGSLIPLIFLVVSIFLLNSM